MLSLFHREQQFSVLHVLTDTSSKILYQEYTHVAREQAVDSTRIQTCLDMPGVRVRPSSQKICFSEGLRRLLRKYVDPVTKP